jgi:tRNA threonylcarbamoyladenosine biosynthesis protein TsaB
MILHIDTSVETASVCLAENKNILQLAVNENQHDHAAWLQPAIQTMLKEAGITVQELNAVAVSIGPGSYTGLRVGLSSAKGLCYALNIPLLTIGTLEMMAYAAKEEQAELLCPMIDARRMEVFTALYDKTLQEIKAPQALILEKNIFEEFLLSHTILFYGNGSMKLKKILDHPHALFKSIIFNASHMVLPAYDLYKTGKKADLAYTEPLYVKEFFTPPRKSAP